MNARIPKVFKKYKKRFGSSHLQVKVHALFAMNFVKSIFEEKSFLKTY